MLGEDYMVKVALANRVKEKNCLNCDSTFVLLISGPGSTKQKYCSSCETTYGDKLYPSYRKWETSEAGRKYMKEYHATNKAKYKKLVFDHYGWSCNCCSEKTIEFLSIDHVYGGGSKQRRENNIRGLKLYKKIISENYPDEYQILCMNCNFGKKITEGLCPHKLV